MEKFNPIVLVELQNILSIKNIERLKSDFITKSIDPEEQPQHIDYEKGLVYYYNSAVDDITPFKFENQLKEILWQFTNKLKSEIDLSNTLLSNKEKFKYWQNVLNTLNYIKEINLSVFELFPICYKPQETIKEYLSNKYHFNPISQFQGASRFTLIPKYSNNDLKKVYDFITAELFLDDELISFEDFKSVLFDIDTDKTLVFNCDTPIIINILDKLKHLFTDLTRSEIEKSARFFTKPGIKKESKPITVGIYQSSLNRFKKPELVNNINKVKLFFEENFKM